MPARAPSPAPSYAWRVAIRVWRCRVPTFTLVQSYETRIGTVHHFDLWRLDGPDGLAELGWEDVGDGVVLVEWPDRLHALRPQDALTLQLHLTGAYSRRAVLSGWPDRLGRIA